MDIQTLRRSVRERARLDDDAEAQRLVEATLATLAERITKDEAQDLAAQLPDELQWAAISGAGDRFDYAEFVRRVMVRAELGADRAGIQTSAALAVLSEAVSPGEWSDVLAQLPGDDPAAAVAGRTPADPAIEDLRDALRRRPHNERWQPTDVDGEWSARSDDDLKHGYVRAIAGEFEARVHRRPTGPHGPPQELAHGPQVFAFPDDAIDYAEANLGT